MKKHKDLWTTVRKKLHAAGKHAEETQAPEVIVRLEADERAWLIGFLQGMFEAKKPPRKKP